MTKDLRWKFLREEGGKIVSQSGRATWTIGTRKTLRGGDIICCSRGFHSSPGILAALGYVKGEVLAQVSVEGQCIEDGDKTAHRSMTLVRAWRWTQRDSVALAVFAAEQVIGIFEAARPGDDRPRNAIEAARASLADPSLASAAYAANAAADAAAYAARADAYAARAAAYAARAAAAAARAAAYAASDVDAYAAYAAAGVGDARGGLTARIEEWLQAHVAELEEIAP
jgi:hypothetical protein